MNRQWVRAITTAVTLGAALAMSAPAFADGHGRGGAGGGSFGGSRGGYSMGHGAAASGGRMSMAPSRSAGFSGSRAIAPAYSGSRFSSPRVAAPAYNGGHFNSPRASMPVYNGGRFNSPRVFAPTYDGSRVGSPRTSAPTYNGGRVGSPRSSAPTYNGGRFSSPRTSAPIYDSSRVGSPRTSAPVYNGSRLNSAADRRFSSAAGTRYSPGRVSSSPRFDNRPTYRPDHRYTGRPGFDRTRRDVTYGWRPRYWAGGTFHGYYWPRAYYHPGFVSFVAVLPAYYSTFWFAGVPYYYWDYTYYRWSPSAYGYVATDPPPAAQYDGSDSGSAEPESSDSSNVYIYPKNGQSEAQTATDRYECHQWAVSQTGFDPTSGANQAAGSAGPSDYRRAMIACLDARGYSAH